MDAAPLGVCAPNIVERHVQRLRACIAKVARGAFRVPGSVTDRRRLLYCSSRVMGNYHARFLGGWARATAPGYPPPAANSKALVVAAQTDAGTRPNCVQSTLCQSRSPAHPLRGAFGASLVVNCWAINSSRRSKASSLAPWLMPGLSSCSNSRDVVDRMVSPFTHRRF